MYHHCMYINIQTDSQERKTVVLISVCSKKTVGETTGRERTGRERDGGMNRRAKRDRAKQNLFKLQ